ncbi:MAG: DUF721 domain-containing protein [Pseudomonadota bacterium]|nr:DUF721 domain-containing protein [Pseudomonadota bacterium]
MARRRSPFKPFPLAAILQKVVKKRGLPLTIGDPYLRRVWNETVGDGIAAETAPENIKRGVLYVKVSSPVWVHHLQFLKKDILQRFNELHGKGAVRELHLTVGVIAAPARPDGEAVPAATNLDLTPRDKRLMKESLAQVSDPELQEILRRVMTRAISRRRFLEKRKDR